MQYLPDLEMVEIDASNFPRILVPINQVSYMEPVQEKAALPTPGPEVITTEQLAELQKEAEPVNLAAPPPEGARDSTSPPMAPEPDLRPPPKAERGMSKRLSSHDTLTDDPPKESRFGKIGKRKPGRPKKGSKS